MLFSSISFLYLFLPITLILYFLIGFLFRKKGQRLAQNVVLLLSSLFFYGWGEPRYVLIMLGEIIISYVFGILIEKNNKKAAGKILLVAFVIIELGFLGYFKYVDFFIDSFGKITGLDVKLLGVALPIGISFYTFQILSYVIDVYRGTVAAQKNFINLATYVAMFPQLIAGPIVRYIDVEKQLRERDINWEKIGVGVRRFVLGLGKKVFLANALGELCNIYRTSEQTVAFAWAYAICYALHVYFDFSGYSDMAIGIGKILGFDFLENFNYPYISRSISEFWRRWHMSLGGWFRDYVYIPLGGNRVSKVRWLFNILIVWFLTGFWHGAAVNFILWGLFYGVLLLLERPIEKKVPRAVGHIYVTIFTIIGFIIFGAESMSQAGWDIAALVGFSADGRLSLVGAETLYYLKSFGVIIMAALVGATPLPKLLVEKISATKVGSKVMAVIEPIFLMAILVVVTAFLVDGSFNPFLYFRF